MTIWVIGNCQARGVAKSVESLTKSSDVRPLDIRTIMQADDAGKANLASQVSRSDILLIQKPDDHAGPFSIERLRASGYRAVAFPSFGFAGFHPDLCYIKCNGVYINGALFSYHSSIVAAAYLEGLSQQRACALFNRFTYASLGLRGVYDATLPILKKHMAEAGHDHSEALSRGVFMHTINHPWVELLFEVAKQALNMAGVPTHSDAGCPPDELGEGVVWPVYPGISNDIAGNFDFQIRAGEIIDLQEFVAQSYDSYGILSDGYEAIRVDKAREFIQRELIKPKAA